MRSLDVNRNVLTRDNNVYMEPWVDGKGMFTTTTGEVRRPDQVKPDDTIVMRPITIGHVINAALDRIDDKLTGEERRKRWSLSLRVQEALNDGVKPLIVSREDETRILAAVDALMVNLLVGRVYEAVEGAPPYKPSEGV